ncbi:hypothetical protein E4K73_43160 [Streptomyces sp. IB201691-2A2]|nr:hypothetical protein E4K73_43160 [Streptomyces sp. IB201691-2A2]
MRDATFCPADLTTFCRLDDLGLEVVGQHLHPDHAVLLCDWSTLVTGVMPGGCLKVPRETRRDRLGPPARALPSGYSSLDSRNSTRRQLCRNLRLCRAERRKALR